MLNVWQGKAVLTKVTKAWRILAPPGPPLFQFLFLCLSPPQGVGLLSEFVFVCFVTFLGESDVRWLCLVGIVYLRGAVVSRRSHGPGCAAVSPIGAIQWCSL